jgi:hypothetical protein
MILAMKKILKTILIFFCIGISMHLKANGLANKSMDKDSIIINFGAKSKVIIYAHTKADLDALLSIDMNKLLLDIKQKLDTVSVGKSTIHEEILGVDYLKQPLDSSQRELLSKIYIKGDSTQIRVAWDQQQPSVEDTTVEESQKYKKIYKHGFGSSPRKGFNVKLGLNRYGQNDPGNLYQLQDYDLKPFQSRTVALEYIASAKLAKGKRNSLHLDFGVDFSWYNLMFDGNNTVAKNESRVLFPVMELASGNVKEFKKSKLVIPNLNLSLMPTLKFSKSFVSYVSAGMYGGYRLGSYTKTIEKHEKVKNKEHENYHLYDFRYGLALEMGIRNFPDLFVNYDLNETFQHGAGPKVKMFSFGVRLF